jgi:hypothetical protein
LFAEGEAVGSRFIGNRLRHIMNGVVVDVL